MRLSSASSTVSRGSRLTMPTMPHIVEPSVLALRARGDRGPPRRGRPDECLLVPAWPGDEGRGQLAKNNRRKEFPRQPAREPSHSPDRHRLEALDRECALLDQLAGAFHRHPVEAALDLREPGGAVGPEIRPPPDEGGLCENEMGPGEHGKHVATDRVKPGWSERDQDPPIVIDE